MENTSKHTKPLSRRDIAYYRRRQQNRLFSGLAQFFANEAESGRITRKEIAQRLDKDPAQITRWLSSPTNFELDTISDLLLAMGAEMDTRIVRFSDRAKPNYVHPLTRAATNALQQISFEQRVNETRKPAVTAAATLPSAIGEITLNAAL